MKNLLVRRATENDIPEIVRLVNFFAGRGVMLPRDAEDIKKYLGNFCVAVLPCSVSDVAGGSADMSEGEAKLAGCAAARDFGGGLYEVRSLAVDESCHRKGVGRKLVSFLEKRLKEEKLGTRLFALTVRPDFFTRLGFKTVDKSLFPEKIWSDCVNCPKRECCDEVAVLKEL